MLRIGREAMLEQSRETQELLSSERGTKMVTTAIRSNTATRPNAWGGSEAIVASNTPAQEEPKRGSVMQKYLIQASHNSEECIKYFEAYVQGGSHYLTHSEWGCADGVHTGWLIVEAECEAEARNMVPPVVRHKALLIRLQKFGLAELRQLHESAS